MNNRITSVVLSSLTIFSFSSTALQAQTATDSYVHINKAITKAIASKKIQKSLLRCAECYIKLLKDLVDEACTHLDSADKKLLNQFLTEIHAVLKYVSTNLPLLMDKNTNPMVKQQITINIMNSQLKLSALVASIKPDYAQMNALRQEMQDAAQQTLKILAIQGSKELLKTLDTMIANIR